MESAADFGVVLVQMSAQFLTGRLADSLEQQTCFLALLEAVVTELAHELLHVIQESDCSAALKAEMCNDLIDNVPVTLGGTP